MRHWFPPPWNFVTPQQERAKPPAPVSRKVTWDGTAHVFAVPKLIPVSGGLAQALGQDHVFFVHLMQAAAEKCPDRMCRKQAWHAGLRALEEDQDLLDLLEDFPSARPKIEELVPLLGHLQPRLFSIASASDHLPVEMCSCAYSFMARGNHASNCSLLNGTSSIVSTLREVYDHLGSSV